ncbi:MAG: DUF1414 domain-containing protein [Idiomarina sp.]|nr:DUF1414 domain-containing protein [Idiomarina sp.]
MPIVSKYSKTEQDDLFDALLQTFADKKVPADLALMTLGSLVTHVLSQHKSLEKREALARQFGAILLQSVTQTNSEEQE